MSRKTLTAARPLRAVFVASPELDRYPVTESIVEQADGQLVMFMLTARGVIQVAPDRPTIEAILDHRSHGIVNAAAQVMVKSVQEARRQVGEEYHGPTGWGG